MQFNKLIIYSLYCILITFTSGCANVITSAVEAGVVFVVAKHDETVEKKQKQYTALDKCLIKGEPEALNLGNEIAYGQQLTAKYDKILSRTGEDAPPVEPHKLAYAFYIIAFEIDDKRAKERMDWIEKQMTPQEAAEIRDVIHDKFLISNLEKCFYVPGEYKIKKNTRQLIHEERIKEDSLSL